MKRLFNSVRRFPFPAAGVSVLAAALFCLLFCCCTSPLYEGLYGEDPSFFLLYGRVVSRGLTPYRDLLDTKGPVMFFIQWLGVSLCDGREGIFWVQLLFLACSVFLCCRLARLFTGRVGMLLCLIPTLLLLSVTIEGGNLTEEFSLPFLLLPLWMEMRFLQGEERPHPWGYGLCCGVCFGVLFWIRPTNAAPVAGMFFYLALSMAVRRQWRCLMKNATAFLCGVLLVTAPILLWFWRRDAVGEMLYCCLILPFFYAEEGLASRSGALWLTVLRRLSPGLLALSAGLTCRTAGGEEREQGRLLFWASLFAAVALLPGNGYHHYFILLEPLFLASLAMLIRHWQSRRSLAERETGRSGGGEGTAKRRRPGVASRLAAAAVAASALLLLCYYPGQVYNTWRARLEDLTGRDYLAFRDVIVEQTSLIPPEERDSVLGYDLHPRWYAVSNILPCSRFALYQSHYMGMDSRLEREFYAQFQEDPPVWLGVNYLTIGDNPRLMAILEADYRLIDTKGEALLYRRIDDDGQ